MRGKTVSSGGIQLVSISVSFVALRLLLKAAESAIKSPAVSAFRKSAGIGQPHELRTRDFRLLPCTDGHPVDAPITRRKPSRTSDLHSNSKMADGIKAEHVPQISVLLWNECQLEAMRSLHHPWACGLASGRTTRSSFKTYIAQDAYFLRAFAKAYAFALTKTADEEGVRAFHSLIGSVLEELSLHASFALKWGIDIHQVPPPVQATSEYVHFLLAVASDPTSTVSQVLASMVPCMRLYAFLGKELRQAFPKWSNSSYAEWIETYSSQEFEAAAALVESLLDKYSSEADYDSLLELYRKAMELEYAFFDAQCVEGTAEDDRPGRHTRKSIGLHEKVALLCVDFDDTLTDGDTTNLLVKAAEEQRDTPAGKEEIAHEWTRLTRAFFVDSNAVIEEVLDNKRTKGESGTSQCEQLDREGLEGLLRRLEKVDLDSVARVSRSQVLRGITRESVQVALSGPLRSHWKVRPGMARCLSRALASPFVTHVVSINWSRDVITSILAEAIPECSGGMKPGGGRCQSVPVSSNDLAYDGHGLSTGEVAVSVPGSSGKHQRFLDLAKTARGTAGNSGQGTESTRRNFTIYVGDSVTDLLAMLDADIGIVVGNSSTFTRVADAFGISIRPLASAYEALEEQEKKGHGKRSGDGNRSIYRASNWAEIDVFVFGSE